MKQHTRIEAKKGGSSIDDTSGGFEDCLITISEGRINTKEKVSRITLRDITA